MLIAEPEQRPVGSRDQWQWGNTAPGPWEHQCATGQAGAGQAGAH